MNFRAGALAMLLGTIVSQALPLLVAPLLTRVYTPQAFGVQSLFMGLAGTIAVLATCRMDLAIVLPGTDEEAAPVAATLLGCATVVTLLTALGVAAARAAGAPLAADWIWMLPIMVLSIALMQLGVGLASRERSFKRVALANVGNQASYASLSVGLGLAGSVGQGLVIAKLAGQVLAACMLVLRQWRRLRRAVGQLSIATVGGTLRRYRQFVVFNTPYSLVGAAARDVPVYLFTAWAAIQAAGFFGLARTVLLAPTLLTSNALSQVFYREAVALKGSPQLERFTGGLIRAGMLTCAPLFAFCAIWGDTLFLAVFGAAWSTAGTFAMLLAPAAWMSVQTGWPERLFEVNMRQGVSFSVQLTADVLTAAAFALAYLVTGDPLVAVGVFAACNIGYHHAYLAAIYRVSGFGLSGLWTALRDGWLTFGLACVVLGAARAFMGTGTLTWLLCGMAACAAAAAMGWRLSDAMRAPVPASGRLT